MNTSKITKPLDDENLAVWEATRDIEFEIVESIGQMVRGETTAIDVSAIDAYKSPNTHQSESTDFQ